MNILKNLKRLVAALLVCLMLFPSATSIRAEELELYSLGNLDESVIDRYLFEEYIADNAGIARPDIEIIIPAVDYYSLEDMEVEILRDFHGQEGESLFTDEYGSISWLVDVPQAGLYNISILYFAPPGKNSDVQRIIRINGETPFLEASQLEFRRTWVNQHEEIRSDNRGNQLRPPQIERHMWRESLFEDSMGSFNEPFSFYFQEGQNLITLISRREPMVINHLRLFQAPSPPSYAEYIAARSRLPRPLGVAEVTQGQDAARRSSPMLQPSSDNSSPAVEPYSASAIMINNIGGSNWRTAGQWIEWDFYAPEAGLYKIAINVKQNVVRGASVFRRISINGEVPFREMEAVGFGHQNSWRMETLGGEEEPYLFELNQGWNSIKMEVVLGDYAPYVRQISESVYNLNRLYRQMVMITGVRPDLFRDYQLGRRLPHLRDELERERIILERVFAELQELSGGRGQRDTPIRTLAGMIGQITSNIEESPRRLIMFRSSIGALGTWLMQVREMSLAVESIHVLSFDSPTPSLNNSFWAYLWHEILSLFYSFFIDYNAIGNVSDEDGETIVVWVGLGRDQANTIKSMIDEDFTLNTNINVNLMLVQMDTLLPATLSGQGPDVAMMVGNDLPMNFGMRGAVIDLTQFNDFEEVTQRFLPSAMVPFTFDGRSFGLPETQTFNMMFYRRDIMEELGLDLPRTWDEFTQLLSVFNRHHMTAGLPVTYAAGDQTLSMADFTFTMFLFQAGGALYTEDGSRSLLDSDVSVSTFRDFTRFFTDYGLDETYDFVNRFRVGEMPIAIADYTWYNTLQVFAPEIQGMWGFTTVPATVRADGSISRAVPSGGSSSVIMERSSNYEAAWEYMKWWTSADIQSRFGRGMEALMGAAARYPTANQEAFAMLPWPVADFRSLEAQFEYVQGIPQVPGGYFSGRQINNAFFRVVTERRAGAREALTDFTRFVNEEIAFKRREFGLD